MKSTARSPEAKAWQRLYRTAEWKRLRAVQLAKQPWCQCPCHQGQRIVATVADHIKPHKGNRKLFFDPRNLGSSCKSCHDGCKQRSEKGGPVEGCDVHGRPIDPNHWWNQLEEDPQGGP